MNAKQVKLRSLAGYTPSGDYRSFGVQDADFNLPPATRPPTSFCVAVAVTSEGVAVRSSRDPSKATLFFDHQEWAVFLDGVQKGHFLPPGGIAANMP